MHVSGITLVSAPVGGAGLKLAGADALCVEATLYAMINTGQNDKNIVGLL
jgi:hypothetical protein